MGFKLTTFSSLDLVSGFHFSVTVSLSAAFVRTLHS